MVRRAPFGFRSAVPQPSGRLGRGRPSRQLIDQRRETPQARPPPHAPEHRQGAGREGQTAQAQFPSRTSGVTLGHTKESSSAEALRPHPDSNPGAPRDPGASDEARRGQPPTVPRYIYQEAQISTIARPERTAPLAQREPPRQPRQTAARPQPATTGAHPGAAPRSLPAPSAPGKILCIAASGPGAAARPDQTVGDKQHASVTSAVS